MWSNKPEEEIENVKKELEGTDVEKIKEATEKLTQSFYEISEKLYKQANPNQTAEGVDPNTTEASNQDQADNANVYDADYKVEEDGENK